MRIGITTSIATAIAIGVLIASGGGNPQLANLWVDTNGGTCTRSASAVAYVDADACSSLNTAYAAAQCNDFVNVKAGTYPSVTIDETASGTACGNSARVTLRANQGETVNIPWIGLGSFGGTSSPDNIILIGFVTRLGISLYGDANNATVSGFNGGSFITGPSSTADDSSNILIENSDWGPCGSRSTIGECSHDGTDTCNSGSSTFCGTGRNHVEGNNGHWANGIVIRNNTIHDYPIEGGGDHWECVFVEGGTDVTFENNYFWNCETNAVALPPTQMFGTWYFQNNVFGQQITGDANAALKFAGGPPDGTVIVRYNSFHTDSPLGSEVDTGVADKVRIIGNIIGDSYGCISGAAYFYNLSG